MNESLQELREQVSRLVEGVTAAEMEKAAFLTGISTSWRDVLAGGGVDAETRVKVERLSGNVEALRAALEGARSELAQAEQAQAERERIAEWRAQRDAFEALAAARNEAGQRLEEALVLAGQAAQEVVRAGSQMLRAPGFQHRESTTKDGLSFDVVATLVLERLAQDVPGVVGPVGLVGATARDLSGSIVKATEQVVAEWHGWNPAPDGAIDEPVQKEAA